MIEGRYAKPSHGHVVGPEVHDGQAQARRDDGVELRAQTRRQRDARPGARHAREDGLRARLCGNVSQVSLQGQHVVDGRAACRRGKERHVFPCGEGERPRRKRIAEIKIGRRGTVQRTREQKTELEEESFQGPTRRNTGATNGR